MVTSQLSVGFKQSNHQTIDFQTIFPQKILTFINIKARMVNRFYFALRIFS